jgi:hypothetical protein
MHETCMNNSDEEAYQAERRRRALAWHTLTVAREQGVTLWRDERGVGVLNTHYPADMPPALKKQLEDSISACRREILELL